LFRSKGRTAEAEKEKEAMTTRNDVKDNRDFSSQELASEELSQIVGGESPKETVTFEYGGFVIFDHEQLPDGAVSSK
jgi:hypothetical protein